MSKDELDYYLKQGKIRDCFQDPDLPFRLIRYQRGELLASPEKPLKELLFLVEGNVLDNEFSVVFRFITVNFRNDPANNFILDVRPEHGSLCTAGDSFSVRFLCIKSIFPGSGYHITVGCQGFGKMVRPYRLARRKRRF